MKFQNLSKSTKQNNTFQLHYVQISATKMTRQNNRFWLNFSSFGHYVSSSVCKHAAIHVKGLSLLSLGATQIATNFLMVARVLDVKEALKQTITNVEWDMYVKTLSDI